MNRKNILGMAVAAAFVISVVLVQAQTATVSNLVSAPEAVNMLKEGKFSLVLDVRTPDEYTGPLGHISGARLIPVQSLEDRLKEIEAYKDKTVLVYCHSGVRSAKSAAILRSHGFTKVYDLEGGMMGWKSLGYPSDNKASRN